MLNRILEAVSRDPALALALAGAVCFLIAGSVIVGRAIVGMRNAPDDSLAVPRDPRPPRAPQPTAKRAA